MMFSQQITRLAKHTVLYINNYKPINMPPLIIGEAFVMPT